MLGRPVPRAASWPLRYGVRLTRVKQGKRFFTLRIRSLVRNQHAVRMARMSPESRKCSKLWNISVYSSYTTITFHRR
jgi:hypothetical protein